MINKILIGIVISAIAVTINAQKEIKCEPSEKQIEIITKCFKEVTNKDLKGEDDFKSMDESTEEKIMMCALKMEGIIDEQGFNVEKAEESINDMKTSEEIKGKLLEELKKCATEHDKTKVDAMLECMKDMDMICDEHIDK